MMYTIPFTEESVRRELCDSPMVLARMKQGHPNVRILQEVDLSQGGWTIVDGCLELRDGQNSPTHRFMAIQTTGGRLFLAGDDFRSAFGDGFSKALLYKRLSMGDDFHVVISSHEGNAEDVLPRILRSLKREGVPSERITVATPCGAWSGLRGCEGIGWVIDGKLDPPESYVLLLHDTVEAMPGFLDDVRDIDVGLPYDFIGIAGESGYLQELGFWSTSFLRSCNGMSLNLPKDGLPVVLNKTLRMRRLEGDVVSGKRRDVYGAGKDRLAMMLGIPVKKYSTHERL